MVLQTHPFVLSSSSGLSESSPSIGPTICPTEGKLALAVMASKSQSSSQLTTVYKLASLGWTLFLCFTFFDGSWYSYHPLLMLISFLLLMPLGIVEYISPPLMPGW